MLCSCILNKQYAASPYNIKTCTIFMLQLIQIILPYYILVYHLQVHHHELHNVPFLAETDRTTISFMKHIDIYVKRASNPNLNNYEYKCKRYAKYFIKFVFEFPFYEHSNTACFFHLSLLLEIRMVCVF